MAAPAEKPEAAFGTGHSACHVRNRSIRSALHPEPTGSPETNERWGDDIT